MKTLPIFKSPGIVPADSKKNPTRKWLAAALLAIALPMTAYAQTGAPKPDSVLLDDPASVEYFLPDVKSRTLNTLKAEDKRFATDIGSRVIVPAKQTPVKFEGGRAKVYLQFTRPLSGDERGQITRLGVYFHEPAGNGAYLVTMKEAAYESLKNNPLVRGFEPIQYVDKLTPEVYYGTAGRHVMKAQGQWQVHVRFYANVALDHALSVLDGLDIKAPDRSRFLLDTRLLVEGTQAQLHALAESQIVREIVPIPAPPQDDNVDAAAMSNTDVLQAAPFNLLGNGVNMGQWEGGQVLSTHLDLAGRVTLVEVGSTGGHATHVAGTMIGSGANNASARGMAPLANLFSWINDGDVGTEMSDGVTNQAISTANHSWGISNTDSTMVDNQAIFGLYDASARNWDVAIRASGLIVCNSSGNDNDDTDGITRDGITGADGNQYHTIDSTGNAKNNITVGNLLDDAVNISNSSSTGPTDDGRIKPNIVANGTNLFSTFFDTSNTLDNLFYSFSSGTSMATPTVAGNCALLVERWRLNNFGANPAAEVIKAILIHTATDLGNAGPDHTYGYGLMDAEAALEVLDAAETMVITDAVDVNETDEFLVPVSAGQAQLRVTAVWTDPEGATNANPALVNNLNLELEGPDGIIRFPFSGASAGVNPTAANVSALPTTTGPNNFDNVEQVLVANPPQGFWRARIIGGTGVQIGPQNYALITNIAFALPGDPNITVNAPLAFNEICLGNQEDITVSIFNTGGSDLEVNSVAITSGGPEFSVLENPAQPFIVAPGGHVDVTVRFTPSTIGLKNGILTISSNDPDQPLFESAVSGEGGSGDAIASIANNGSFGDVCVGSLLDLPLTISNNGTCPLKVTGVSSNNAEFITPSGENEISISSPRIIAPGAALQVPIRFQPVLPFGAKAANITILTDDPDPQQATMVRAVTGNSPAPVLEISACPVDFGQACLSNPNSLSKVINICNTGLCPLTIAANGIRFDPATADFQILNLPAFPFTIAPGSECFPLTIQFTPTSPGPKSASITVEALGGIIKTCSVSGSTSNLADGLGLPDRIAFPPTVIQSNGPCGTIEPLPVENVSGNCTAQISDMKIVGDDAALFSFVGLPAVFPVTLGPGELLGDGGLGIKFEPTELVTKRFLSAELQVTLVTDPNAMPPATTTLFIPLAGEAVQSGVRILVTLNGVPVDNVHRLQIKQLGGRQKIKAKNIPLKKVIGPAGFADLLAFDYHLEAGGISAPNQRLTGDHKVTAKIKVGKKTLTRNVNLSLDTCTFDNTMIINF